MDISEKYIKMAGAADDIQKDWEPQVGDWYYDGNYPRAVGIWQSSLPIDTLIWLPGQRNLQAMLKERKTTYFLIEDFSDFICENLLEDHGDVPYTPPFKKEWEKASMEMLWLAFVMWERFSKCWDNEKEAWTEISMDGKN